MSSGRFVQMLIHTTGHGMQRTVYRLVEGECCCSQEHKTPELATRIAHMVQGPTPYCDDCASIVKQVYDALGTHLHIEEAPLTVLKEVDPDAEDDRGARQIDLG